MTERRHQVRIQRSLECAITIDRHEYTATILDISQEGIAFAVGRDVGIHVGDVVVISVADTFADGNTFLADMIGTVMDLSEHEKTKIRCGCHINDHRYSKYVQELLIARVCRAD